MLVQGLHFENDCDGQPLEGFKFGRKMIRFAFYVGLSDQGKGINYRLNKRELNELVFEVGREDIRKSS